ncbi:MAG TPA: acyltransferase [Rhizomicrobium sp.]|jgi:peptidoglycan/LPS O-acetylase OafA/YrhL
MRMKQLDTLRAFALGLVMVEHYGGRALNEYIPIGAGSVGVGMFFTLSGFLITGILLQSFDAGVESKGKAWLDFYARRLLRLVPAYYAVILALVVMGIAPIAQSWPWHVAYLSNVWIAQGNPDNVFWSLSVEEQFYLFWPFVIAFAPRRWLVPAILAMAVMSLLFKLGVVLGGYNTRDVNRLLFGNLVLLGAGCLLAVVSYHGRRANCFDWYEGRTRRWFTALAWLGLGLAVLSWALFPKEGGMVRYFTNDLLVGPFYAWVVLQAAVGLRGLPGRIFDSPSLQYIGRISYGLYLVHNWMPDIVDKYFGPMPKYQAAPIVLALTFGVCILSWHFFEKPILGLKRFFWNSKLKEPIAPENEVGNDSQSRETARAY